MLLAMVSGIAGLLVGAVGAVAWTAGFHQGLAATRTLSGQRAEQPREQSRQ